MIGQTLEVTPTSTLLIEVDVSEMANTKATEYMLKIKEDWKLLFPDNQVVVVPLGRIKVSAINL